jgi:hypothetical protein
MHLGCGCALVHISICPVNELIRHATTGASPAVGTASARHARYAY